MRCLFKIRIYYLTNDLSVMRKFKERFNTIISVNGESVIYTDEVGKDLIVESERRRFIKIREIKAIQWR